MSKVIIMDDTASEKEKFEIQEFEVKDIKDLVDRFVESIIDQFDMEIELFRKMGNDPRVEPGSNIFKNCFLKILNEIEKNVTREGKIAYTFKQNLYMHVYADSVTKKQVKIKPKKGKEQDYGTKGFLRYYLMQKLMKIFMGVESIKIIDDSNGSLEEIYEVNNDESNEVKEYIKSILESNDYSDTKKELEDLNDCEADIILLTIKRRTEGFFRICLNEGKNKYTCRKNKLAHKRVINGKIVKINPGQGEESNYGQYPYFVAYFNKYVIDPINKEYFIPCEKRFEEAKKERAREAELLDKTNKALAEKGISKKDSKKISKEELQAILREYEEKHQKVVYDYDKNTSLEDKYEITSEEVQMVNALFDKTHDAIMHRLTDSFLAVGPKKEHEAPFLRGAEEFGVTNGLKYSKNKNTHYYKDEIGNTHTYNPGDSNKYGALKYFMDKNRELFWNTYNGFNIYMKMRGLK